MDSLDSDPCFVDDLLNFSSDMEEEEEKDNRDKPRRALASTSLKPDGLLGPDGDSVRPYHGQDFVEEELEWISNKDAFPAVESFVGILPEQPSAAVLKLHSPVSVLDDGSGGSTISSNSNSTSNCNSSNGGSSITTLTSCFGSLKAPRRARSKRRCRRRRGDVTGRQLCWSQANNNSSSNSGSDYVKEEKTTRMTTMGRKCQHCGADKTPQWRAGPYGPKTLCNACGVRYKSGRLVPEYRPASSPSFSNALHSNSHRKILEMRRSKLMMGMVVKQPLGSG